VISGLRSDTPSTDPGVGGKGNVAGRVESAPGQGSAKSPGGATLDMPGLTKLATDTDTTRSAGPTDTSKTTSAQPSPALPTDYGSGVSVGPTDDGGSLGSKILAGLGLTGLGAGAGYLLRGGADAGGQIPAGVNVPGTADASTVVPPPTGNRYDVVPPPTATPTAAPGADPLGAAIDKAVAPPVAANANVPPMQIQPPPPGPVPPVQPNPTIRRDAPMMPPLRGAKASPIPAAPLSESALRNLPDAASIARARKLFNIRP
jgi:hypothetical protein